MGDKTPKKRSIDEMIGNMTADLHNSDGQYIQLGFTPPPTPASSSPHVWSEYSIPSNPGPVHPYLHPSMVNNPDPTPVYLSDLNMHYGMDSNLMKQNEMHQNYYYAAHQHLLADSRMMDGNLYGVNSNGQNPNLNQSYHMLPPENPREIHRDVHPLGGFMPYHQSNVMDQLPQHDYGLFNNPGDMCSRQMQQQYQPNMTNQDQLIENLVGNWVPNQTGTYSPFGCVDTGLKPTTNQQTTQTAESDSDKGIGRGFRNRQRIVAEVRPMRPSYSDVLAKSPPATIVPIKNPVRPDKIKPQTVKNANKKNGKGGTLKRQHSSGSDEHTGNGNGNNNGGCKIQSPASTRKSTDSGNKNDAFNSMPRKWVSLDDLDSDKKLEEEVFQPEEVTRTNETGSKKQSKKNQHANNWDNASTLNNHKPSNGNGNKGTSGGSGAKRPIHINNNLGTSPWANSGGQTGAAHGGQGEKNILKGRNCKTCSEDKKGNASVKPEPKASARAGSGRSTSVSSASQNVDKSTQGKRGGQRTKRKEYASSPLAVFCRPMKQHLNRWAAVALQIVTWFLHLLSDVLGMSLKLLVHLFGFVCDWLASVSVQGYRKLGNVFVRVRIFDRLGFSSGEGSPKRWWNFWSREKPSKTNNRSANTENEGKRFKFPPGLENNISLPSTGEEAMKRLLACKGKDPYSILGVTPHCTDDDVKKYYKRQAFLVHPDKNNQPGAEEAFKILVHAFELIGEPERRKAYERRVAETQQVEQAWSELSDLLSQLHQKMEYAANTIRCTNCGKRHRRVAVERPCYAARMCAQCKIHHAAREGDIWAESSMLGFLWHYYACMDGAVFDITEWAACQAENLKHLRANTHNVQYRIVLGKQQQPYSRSGQHRAAHKAHESNSEPDLEDFLNNLYSQSAPNGTASGDGGGGGGTDQGRGRKKGKRRK